MCHSSVREETDLESCHINKSSLSALVKSTRRSRIRIHYNDFESERPKTKQTQIRGDKFTWTPEIMVWLSKWKSDEEGLFKGKAYQQTQSDFVKIWQTLFKSSSEFPHSCLWYETNAAPQNTSLLWFPSLLTPALIITTSLRDWRHLWSAH